MKKMLLSLLVMVLATATFAQSEKQVRWTFESKKISDNTYEVRITADIGGNFHMYAQDGGDGPVSTTFDFTKNPLISFDGKVKEVGKMKKIYEEAFGSEVRYYEKKVDFVQVVKVKGKAKPTLAGKVEFMVCNDKECLPPSTVNFKVALGG
ncbi:protein-disulfide reductase DsbD domain-containing protein [Flavihumibacter sp. UBA7668]|uniref:protein-disulfide reductase DsbD domain-containing protein n=1 Tax=Flavihumibacter sp. UBA7668 TaxID=1946542 RepID=UPI0025C16F9C|nr:protein-disulfide reductase DsbD domain-containing protein [Flavihumibacter sp. UBA7668]